MLQKLRLPQKLQKLPATRLLPMLATAKALAEEAKAAGAQAKADAIAEAATQVEALRNSMQAAIDNKLDVTVHEVCCKSTRCSD
ncbi:hypothetical protein NXW76_12825 [Bacteroides thetaiotaomicron]|nr:hypothetical protein [Bacteroides thetaiotaomicron]